MSENPGGGIYSPSNDPAMKHYTDRYDTLPKAHAEIMRLLGVCEDWARKYKGWRDACLEAEATVERLREKYESEDR